MNADEGPINSVTFTISWIRGFHQKKMTSQCQDQNQLPVQLEKTSWEDVKRHYYNEVGFFKRALLLFTDIVCLECKRSFIHSFIHSFIPVPSNNTSNIDKGVYGSPKLKQYYGSKIIHLLLHNELTESTPMALELCQNLSLRGFCPLGLPRQGLCPWTPPGALMRAPGPHPS